MADSCGHGIVGYCTRCNDESWRQAALAFEHRAMRIEYVLRLLVAAGHVTQEKVDEACALAKDFKRAPSGVGASYKLVPVEPTAAMLEAVAPDNLTRPRHEERDRAAAIYRAMVAADGVGASETPSWSPHDKFWTEQPAARVGADALARSMVDPDEDTRRDPQPKFSEVRQQEVLPAAGVIASHGGQQ